MSDIYQESLRNQQYASGVNLDARIQLHTRFSVNKKGLFAWILDLMLTELPIRGALLEVGCGTGQLWLRNRHRVPSGWRLTLTDFSPGMLAEASRNLAGQLPDQPLFRVVDAAELPFPDECFDAVVADHMLYHVPDRPKALAEFKRVLRPNGKLFAATNGYEHMADMHQLADRFNLHASAAREEVFRVRSFALENGEEQLAPYFSRVRVAPYEDGLHITEAEPVVAYINSMLTPEQRAETGPALEELRAAVQAQIDQHGALDIAKYTGMFIASK